MLSVSATSHTWPDLRADPAGQVRYELVRWQPSCSLRLRIIVSWRGLFGGHHHSSGSRDAEAPAAGKAERLSAASLTGPSYLDIYDDSDTEAAPVGGQGRQPFGRR